MKGSTTLNGFWATIKPRRYCRYKFNKDKTTSSQLRRKIEAALPNGLKPNLMCATSRANRGTCKGKEYSRIQMDLDEDHCHQFKALCHNLH